MHLLPDTVYMFMPAQIEFVPTGLLEDSKAVNPGGGDKWSSAFCITGFCEFLSRWSFIIRLQSN